MKSMLAPRRAGGRPADGRPIRMLEIVLVCAIGALLPLIFLAGLAPFDQPPTAPPPHLAAADPAGAGPINPFRTAEAPAAAPAGDLASGPDLAETTLNLALHGTWTNEKGGTAIIRLPDDTQGRFSVGDAITDGVTLDRVYRDQVVIIRNGVRESLRLINRDGAPRSAGAPPIELVDEFGGEIDAGIASIGELIVALPEEDDVGGMRLVLQPAGDQEQFEALGLQAGDTLVAVDNQPIGRDIASGLDVLASLDGKASVTLSVERDGAVMPIKIALPDISRLQNDQE